MSYQTMEVRPIAGALGAEVYGVNLKDRDDSPMWPSKGGDTLDVNTAAAYDARAEAPDAAADGRGRVAGLRVM